MFKEFRKECETALKAVLKRHEVSVEPVFSIPKVERFGDLSTNVCYQLASRFKTTPHELAETLAKEHVPGGYIKEVKAERGYLNFYLNYPVFAPDLVKGIDSDFGRGGEKEKIIVEHTSANPDGPLHIGHLRNAVVGDSLSKILKFAGYNVEVHYYLNDMGKQTAKVVWGRRKFKVGKGKKDLATSQVYIKANRVIQDEGLEDELSKILSDYEKSERGVVKEFSDAVWFCLEGIKETLSRLGIKHDVFIWESRFVRDGSVEKVVEELKKTRYAAVDEGALILDLKDFGIKKEMVLTRSDGTSLYIARDLAHHSWKMKQGIGINIWGADHKLMAQQLKAGLTILGLGEPEFIIHEFISLPEGSMSTRKGVFISADELIDETVEKAFEEVKSRREELDDKTCRRIAEEVGVSAVRFNIARVAPEKSMVFNWDEALDFERQGAPFIQYAYARGKGIMEKSGKTSGSSDVELVEGLNDDEKRLVKTLSRFPESVEEAASSRKVSSMAGYAIDLSNAFHRFYMSTRVIGSKQEVFRLKLVEGTVIVLESVMDLMGVRKLIEM